MRSLQRADADPDRGGDAADDGERRRRRECRLSAAFVACFQSSHIWGNLVSSLMLDDRLRDGAAAAPALVEDGSTNSSRLHLAAGAASYDDDLADLGVYCGVYTPCDQSPASDVWTWDNPGIRLLLLFWHAPIAFTEDGSGPGRLLRSV